MKIIIDINHPAHVHYFKNMITLMEKRGHEFLVISRNKEIEHVLLEEYKIPFLSRGKGGKGIIQKILYYFKAVKIISKQIKKFRPEFVISFGTPYPAIASKLNGIDHINIYDTEHAKLHLALTNPFSSVILTPSCFMKDLDKKHIKFNGYMELAYLHKHYFKKSINIEDLLNIDKEDKIVLIRFVSWEAVHDIGYTGLTLDDKTNIVEILTSKYKVFISSEDELPDKLIKYKINIAPDKIHEVMCRCSLFIGEGATMASECAMLGVPAIYINSLEVGYCTELENRYNLVYNFRNKNGVLDFIQKVINDKSILSTHKYNMKKMQLEKIDVTKFFVWFFENYPMSIKIMKTNPDYQNNFLVTPNKNI